VLVKFTVDLFSVAPPDRPTAPKPGQQHQLPAAAFVVPQDAVLGMPDSLGQPPMMGMPRLSSSEAPKLKDYLPFMKPGSFGPKAQVGSYASTVSNDCAPGSAGSLPPSVSASPVHLPQAPVSFPPSPQRQLPVSISASNSYGGATQVAGTGFVHPGAGYPVAEALLSPTAPPGAPRSASPLHHQPPTAAHPGGPVESQQPSRPMDMSYHIPQSYSQSSVSHSSVPASTAVLPVSAGSASHTGNTLASYAGLNGHSLSSQADMQLPGQPPAVSTLVYSGPFNQPGMYTQSGVHIQHALPNSTSTFQSQIPGQPSVLPSSAVNVPPGTGVSTHPQHAGLSYGSVGNIASSAVPANWNQSYPGANVAVSSVQQPSIATATPGLPVHQMNNSNNVHSQFSSTDASQPSNIEVSKPHYYQTPATVPPTCTALPSPYHSMQSRPPSYEVVSQHYPPVTLGYAATRPGFTGPHLPPVRPELSRGSVYAGNLPAGSQQPVTSIHPQHVSSSQSQQLPTAHQMVPVIQRPFAPPQRPVMPASAAYVEQQPQHVSQNQPSYPLASQTVPGLPMPSQRPSGVSQTPSHPQIPANVQTPVSQPQPRYSAVSSASCSYPAGVQQLQPAYHNASQQIPLTSHMQPAAVNQQQHYQQYPVRPNRPEVGYTPGYLPGSQAQPVFPGSNQAYQDSSQPTSGYHQPPPVNSQQMHYQSSVPQQQPLYHPGSSQPPVVNQSTAISSNFTAPQTPYSNQHQPRAGAPYSHSVNNAPGEMQAFADIPVCLPSPLQPSRVSDTTEVSKNVDSLRDLDLSGRTSPAVDAHPKQKDATGKHPNVDTSQSKDLAADSCPENVEEQRENSEEETRRSLRQSRSSRDVYANSDTLARFVADVEKFQKHVDSLVKPTLGGYFPLDKEWKVSFCDLCICCHSVSSISVLPVIYLLTMSILLQL